jgi:hypothetical protein
MSYIDQLRREDRELDAIMVEDYERLLGNADRTGEEEAELRRLQGEMERIFPKKKAKRK